MDTGFFVQPEALLLVGLLLKVTGLWSRDESTLRWLVLAGIWCDLGFLVLDPGAILTAPILATVIVLANVVVIAAMLRERSTIGMPKRARALYKAFDTLTPGQFRRVFRLAELRRTTEPVQVIAEGTRMGELFYVEGFRFAVKKGTCEAEAKGPAFVGEIGFLTGAAASASVLLPPGTPYVAWDGAALSRLMARNPALKNALVARFSLDLARKVALSLPMATMPNATDPTAPLPVSEANRP